MKQLKIPLNAEIQMSSAEIKVKLLEAGFDMGGKPIVTRQDHVSLYDIFEQEKSPMLNNENPTGLPKGLSLLRMKFLAETEGFESQATKRTYLIVAVKLPTGAIELITNADQLQTKIEYYKNAYDDNFCLKTNPAIQIVGFMLV